MCPTDELQVLHVCSETGKTRWPAASCCLSNLPHQTDLLWIHLNIKYQSARTNIFSPDERFCNSFKGERSSEGDACFLPEGFFSRQKSDRVFPSFFSSLHSWSCCCWLFTSWWHFASTALCIVLFFAAPFAPVGSQVETECWERVLSQPAVSAVSTAFCHPLKRWTDSKQSTEEMNTRLRRWFSSVGSAKRFGCLNKMFIISINQEMMRLTAASCIVQLLIGRSRQLRCPSSSPLPAVPAF